MIFISYKQVLLNDVNNDPMLIRTTIAFLLNWALQLFSQYHNLARHSTHVT